MAAQSIHWVPSTRALRSHRLRLRLAAVLIATVLSLVVVLWGMDVGRSVDAMLAYDVVWIVPLLLVVTVVLVLRALRYQLLLDHPMSLKEMLPIVAVSFLAISVVPLRMGELVRPYLLAEKHGVPFGAAMAAVVLERLFDMVALLILLGATGLFVDLPESIVVGGLDLLAVGQSTLAISASVGFAGVLALAFAGGRIVPVVVAIAAAVSPGLADAIENLLMRFVDGLRVLVSNPGRTALAGLCTVGTWSLMLSTVWLSMMGMEGIAASVDLVLLNWSSAMMGTVLFPTPGFLGAFEAPSVVSLMVMGVEREVATAYSLGLHALLLGHSIVIGLGVMAWEGWSLMTLVRASQVAEPE